MMPDARTKLSELMLETFNDNATKHDWYYHEIRPMSVPHSWKPGQIVYGDCSKGVQFLCKWAGAPDPMDSGFGPYGNSQTIWLRAKHYQHAGQLQVGDIVTFGHDGEEHAAMVYETGNDPYLWSFGHQGAPTFYRLSSDHRPKQFCHLPVAPIHMSTKEMLKARNTWFAWVAWRLGEGDWENYGKTNKYMRPDVPRVIPLSWWKRYAKFIKNRKKGNPQT